MGYRPLYHTDHRTAKIIAGLGVCWLTLVGAQGPENSLTTASPAIVDFASSRKEKGDGVGEKAKCSTKGASAKNNGVGPTRTSSGPARKNISGYPRRRSRFAKRGEHANEAERAPARRRTACREKNDFADPAIPVANTTVANLLSDGPRNTDYYRSSRSQNRVLWHKFSSAVP